jgi:aerobic carbon-monoxide dehydrogenase medium subunit
MHRFEYFEPATLNDTVALLNRHGAAASLLAGGTDLLVEIKENLRQPLAVINIKRIPGIGTIEFDATRSLRFGALTTARDIELHPMVATHYPGLLRAVQELGSIQVRNRATVVGNICRASPSADTLPPLIADGAVLTLVGPAGERHVAMESFFTGPGRTVLAAGEIVTGVEVPAPARGTGKCYIKHGRRKAMELATVGVAVTLTLEGDVCREVRIVLGAVAATPIRATTAEGLLRNQPLTTERIAAAATAAMAESKPISNVRASADYRRDMVGVLTRRAILEAKERAR